MVQTESNGFRLEMTLCHGMAAYCAGARPARRVAKCLLAAALVAAGLAHPAHASFQSGAEAYARGDYQAAIRAWEPYAASNEPRALFNLGQMYRLGVGVEKDLAKAEEYYRRAADQGHVGAQANLGSMLFERKPPQGAEAVKYWRRAAQGGDAKSQYLAGIQYFNGEFVARDYVEAYAWLSLASKAGVREATEALAAARPYMEAKQIKAADKLAGTLVVKPVAQAAVAPTMKAVPDDNAQLDGAVVRHPVDDLVPADLSPIRPDAVRGAIPIPAPGEFAPEPAPAAVAKAADTRDVEYRAQFASFGTEREAVDLRRKLERKHARLLTGADVEVEKLPGPEKAVYRVRTRPLKDEAAAEALCAGVARDRIACQPAKSMRIPVAVRTEAEPARPAGATAAAPPPAAPPAAREEPAADQDPGPSSAHSGDNWRVQVGAGKTEEEARFRWSRLMGSNADLLDAAELYIYKADLGPRGVFYRVQIGGFDKRPAAIALCEKLKTRKVDCFVTATRQ
jgi:cell division septation protein DedD